MSAGALPLRIEIQRQHWLARLFCRGDITALMLGEGGRLSVERPTGREEVVLTDARTVLTGLVILHLRSRDRRDVLAIPVIAIGADAHRRLRVWLRWRARAETSSSVV